MKRTRQSRWILALGLIVSMSVGATCHFWHHIADPECEASGPASQPCATCAGLHSAAVVTDPGIVTRPLAVSVAEVRPLRTRIASAAFVLEGAPRAPPRA